MSVHNFWIECYVDGYQSIYKAGPSAKDGGILIEISQRNAGKATKALTVWGVVGDDGELELTVNGSDGERILCHRTER